jgi:glycosyltransferase involved in cell wall biosynthesis
MKTHRAATERTSDQLLRNGITIVVPTYKSANVLPLLVERLGSALQSHGESFELVLVNDGGRDETWTVIERLALEHAWIQGLCMNRNFGQHNALLTGIAEARFDKVVTMDDDLQHPPEELSKLIAALTPDLDVVYAPPERLQHGLMRNLASQFTKLALASVLGAEVARHVSAWRIFRTSLRGSLLRCQTPRVNLDVLLAWSSTRFGVRPLPHHAREEGESNYSLFRLARHALNMIMGFSTRPLQLASLMGFVFTAFGVVFLAYVVGRFLIFGSSVPGFTFLAAIISIFAGVQLFTLGMIGEYLASVYIQISGRPQSFVITRTPTHEPSEQ